MQEWIKIIIATLVGATLTGVAWLMTEVREVQHTQLQNFVYVERLNQLEEESEDYENRLRELEDELCK